MRGCCNTVLTSCLLYRETFSSQITEDEERAVIEKPVETWATDNVEQANEEVDEKIVSNQSIAANGEEIDTIDKTLEKMQPVLTEEPTHIEEQVSAEAKVDENIAQNNSEEKEIEKEKENDDNNIDNQFSDEEMLKKDVESSENYVDTNNTDKQDTVSIIEEKIEVIEATFSSLM